MPTKKAWPEGFEIAEQSKSPDGRYGVLIPSDPTVDDIDNDKVINTLVNLKTHKHLGVIKASHYFRGKNHWGLSVVWAPDSSWCAVTYEARFGFDTITLVEPKGDSIAQMEIGKHIQKALDSSIAAQAHQKDVGGYASAWFRPGPGRTVLVRATTLTNPKAFEDQPTYFARFAGTFDRATGKWIASEAHKSGDTEALDVLYSDTSDEDLGFDNSKDRLRWHDDRLNEVYAALRSILPAERFAELKKEQIAWLKKLEAADTPAKKSDLIAARINELRKLVW